MNKEEHVFLEGSENYESPDNRGWEKEGLNTAQKELEASRENFRKLVDYAPFGIIIIQNKRIIKTNPTLLKMLGYESEEGIMGRIILDFIHPDFHEIAQSRLGKLMQEKGVLVEPLEEKFLRKDGKKIDVLVYGHSIIFENKPAIQGYIYDITEQKKIEAELQRQTDELNSLFKASQSLASTLDLREILQISIDEAVNVLKLGTGAIYLLEDENLHLRATTPPLPPRFPEEFRYAPLADHPHIMQTLESQRPLIIEDTSKADLAPAEKAVCDIRNLRSLLYVPLISNNNPIGVFIIGSIKEPYLISQSIVALSLTLANQVVLAIQNAKLFQETKIFSEKLKEAYEALKSVDRLKTDIISNVSHELKTPITIIRASMETAFDEENRNEIEELMERGLRALDRQEGIIDDLITLGGEISIPDKYKKPENLEELIRNAMDSKSDFAKKKHIVMEYEIESGLDLIKIHKQRIWHALTNYIDNAIKFNKKNGHIKIKAQKKGKCVQISVSDTGIGIRKTDINKIFRPLTQLDPTIKRRYGGTGTGLAVVKKLVEMHGGEVWVESKFGRGSTFYLSLPLK